MIMIYFRHIKKLSLFFYNSSKYMMPRKRIINELWVKQIGIIKRNIYNDNNKEWVKNKKY